jgi:hypothetical protein
MDYGAGLFFFKGYNKIFIRSTDEYGVAILLRGCGRLSTD